MPTLDRSSPYETIFGLPGAAFSQGGRLFNPGGHEVARVEKFDEESGETRTVCRRVSVDEPPVQIAIKARNSAPKNATPLRFRDIDSEKLKHLVLAYGGEYVDRDQAIAFLEGPAG